MIRGGLLLSERISMCQGYTFEVRFISAGRDLTAQKTAQILIAVVMATMSDSSLAEQRRLQRLALEEQLRQLEDAERCVSSGSRC